MNSPFLNHRAFVAAALCAAICCVWLTASPRAWAQGQHLPKRSAHINDFADLLDVPTRKRLDAVLESLKQKTDVDFVLETVNSIGTEDIYDYSLRLAEDWKVGTQASSGKSLLLVAVADSGKIFSQATPSVRMYLPDGLIGDMGRRIRERSERGGLSVGLFAGVRTFVDRLGELHNFDFAKLDPESGGALVAEQQRPRTVNRSAAEPTPNDNPQPTPAASPTDQLFGNPAPSPTPNISEQLSGKPMPSPTVTPSDQLFGNPAPVKESPLPSPEPTQNPTPTPEPSESPAPAQTSRRRVATVTETPEPSPSPAAAIETPVPSPSATPAATPVVESSTPSPSPSYSPQPLSTSTPSPSETAVPQTSPNATPDASQLIAANVAKPNNATDPKAVVPVADPEDEKEDVELTLTKPLDQRIVLLKAFIADHPTSVAVPRAHELLVMARAMLADKKIAAGDIDGGILLFRTAIAEAPADMPDRLFAEVIGRIPLNLFYRGQRAAAFDLAHQVEALAKSNDKRLLVVAQFYIDVENATEATRVAEALVQMTPDSANAHQALGAARRLSLRLEDAESEYAKALQLNPKSTVARMSLANLKRANGNAEAAVALYREQLQNEKNNDQARAGLIISLLESGKKAEAETALNEALKEPDQSRNLSLLTGTAYWYTAHGDPTRGLELAKKAIEIEPRYSWAEIAAARALVATKSPMEAERALLLARQYSQFPTLDYEMASVLASMGLYDEAAAQLAKSFSLKNGEIETKLAGWVATHSPTFTELLAPERRAAIFQAAAADTDANAKMLKALLAFNAKLDQASANEEDLTAAAQEFTKGDDAMRTYRMIYVAGKLVKKGVALPSVVDLMDQATNGVEAALSVPAATVAVQPEELAGMRAQALAQGSVAIVPDAPRDALSGILRGRIEDLAGLALFNMDKPADAAIRLRRAVITATEGTPLWRSALWHLGAALEANGKKDQALLYYIKSYVAGPPDPARRSIIEKVYKNVNGTLDGLDDKIGPGSSASSGPTPEPSPTP